MIRAVKEHHKKDTANLFKILYFLKLVTSDNLIGMTFDETALNPLMNSKNSQNFQKYEETTPYLPANDSDGETIDSSVKPFRSTAPSLASLKQTKSIEENTSVWSCNDQASHESISPIAKTSVRIESSKYFYFLY